MFIKITEIFHQRLYESFIDYQLAFVLHLSLLLVFIIKIGILNKKYYTFL